MKNLLFVVIVIFVIQGCSEKPIHHSNQELQVFNQIGSTQTPVLIASSSNRIEGFIPFEDTVGIKIDTGAKALEPDTTLSPDEKSILELLEIARMHYLTAMQAQSDGDSVASALEFEEAIKHLNEASYYPDIENNADFNDLTRSVIEDYEKYIATIDSLGIQSSVFALREKLNLEIEKIDITDIQIPASIIPKTEVPLHVNEYTKRTIAFFMGKGRVHIENWIYRSGKYFPLMFRIFEEEGLPSELVYLAMTESGLNPTARSWAKAVGLWQFMKSTGALYGLRSNYWYDERRDFEKSTRAAARHMKDLYADLNDWHLVFAAYNAGPGWVRKASRRAGSNDFWEMRHRLPRETRNYVPQYIAVTLILAKPDAFGFQNIAKAEPLAYETVTIDDCVDLELLAECAGTDLESIRELNPELTQWCTPPNYKGYQFRIPAGTADMFAENYAKIPDDKKFDFATHTVVRGETVGTIAKKYGMTTSNIFEVNKISRKTVLRVGSTLVIPIQSKSIAAVVQAQRKKEIEDRERSLRLREAQRSTAPRTSAAKLSAPKKDFEPSGRSKIVYTVNKGETIGHIAEWFHVRASDIRNWNNIPYGRHIYAGQHLKIWVPEEKYEQYKKIASMSFAEKQHTVKTNAARTASNDTRKDLSNWIRHRVVKGETLEKIAARYDVAIADIKSWNKLKTSRINAGQMLEVYSKDYRNGDGDSDTPEVRPLSSRNTQQQNGHSMTHTVKRGETLEKIAMRYQVTISDLKKWNKISGSKIVIGQKLIVHADDDSH